MKKYLFIYLVLVVTMLGCSQLRGNENLTLTLNEYNKMPKVKAFKWLGKQSVPLNATPILLAYMLTGIPYHTSGIRYSMGQITKLLLKHIAKNNKLDSGNASEILIPYGFANTIYTIGAGFEPAMKAYSFGRFFARTYKGTEPAVLGIYLSALNIYRLATKDEKHKKELFQEVNKIKEIAINTNNVAGLLLDTWIKVIIDGQTPSEKYQTWMANLKLEDVLKKEDCWSLLLVNIQILNSEKVSNNIRGYWLIKITDRLYSMQNKDGSFSFGFSEEKKEDKLLSTSFACKLYIMSDQLLSYRGGVKVAPGDKSGTRVERMRLNP